MKKIFSLILSLTLVISSLAIAKDRSLSREDRKRQERFRSFDINSDGVLDAGEYVAGEANRLDKVDNGTLRQLNTRFRLIVLDQGGLIK